MSTPLLSEEIQGLVEDALDAGAAPEDVVEQLKIALDLNRWRAGAAWQQAEIDEWREQIEDDEDVSADGGAS